MQNKYSVVISPSADARMGEHLEFMARVSVSAAHRLNDTLDEALDFLEHSPKSCPIYTPKIPIDAELRYKLFSERYRIVFEVVDNSVYVYDIQDCRQGMDKNLV